MGRAAPLTSGLLAKKGEAQPTSVGEPTDSHAPNFPELPIPRGESQEKSGGAAEGIYYKNLSVRLTRERYEALKIAGLKRDKSSQEIFVEALELWLRS